MSKIGSTCWKRTSASFWYFAFGIFFCSKLLACQLVQLRAFGAVLPATVSPFHFIECDWKLVGFCLVLGCVFGLCFCLLCFGSPFVS